MPAFTQDSAGNSLLSKVIKYEDLDLELPAYLYSIGIDISEAPFPRFNKAKRSTDYRELYLPLTAALVKRKYTGTITKYGYEVIR
ncbi:MAG TPA: hypothetical protein VMN57_05650 [Anaerolineales bacterium]|nr:hypothetical protein [Anaerolineales bacterium]